MIRIQRNLLLRPEAVITYRNLAGGQIKVRLAKGTELVVSRSFTPKRRTCLGPGRQSP
jgi:hypothetical protein